MSSRYASNKTVPMVSLGTSSTAGGVLTWPIVVSDALSGIASTRWRVDGGQWTPGTAAVVAGSGRHLVEVEGYDAAGNVATMSASAYFDLTPPVTTISGAPSGWSTGTVNLLFSALDNTGGSGVDLNLLQFHRRPALTVPRQHHSVSLEEGTTSVWVWSRDHAGNTETPTVTLVRIDKTPPVVGFVDCIESPPAMQVAASSPRTGQEESK